MSDPKVVKHYHGTDCNVNCNELPEDHGISKLRVSGLTTDTLRVVDKLAGLVCSDDGEITDQDDLSHWFVLNTTSENDRNQAGSVYANRNAPTVGMDKVCHRAMWWNYSDADECMTSVYGVDPVTISVDDDDHGDEQMEAVGTMATMKMNTWTNRPVHHLGSAFAFMADSFCDVSADYRNSVIARLATSPHGFNEKGQEKRDGVLILITAFVPFDFTKLVGNVADAKAEDARVRGIVEAAFSVMGQVPGQDEFANLMKTAGVDFESMRIRATNFIAKGAQALKMKAENKELSKKQRKVAASQIPANVASFKKEIVDVQNKINTIDLFAMERDQEEFIHVMRDKCIRLLDELDKIGAPKPPKIQSNRPVKKPGKKRPPIAEKKTFGKKPNAYD